MLSQALGSNFQMVNLGQNKPLLALVLHDVQQRSSAPETSARSGSSFKLRVFTKGPEVDNVLSLWAEVVPARF